MEIKRDFYLNQLHIRENNGFVKIITGIRRSGKSYLVFKLFLNELLQRGIERNHIIDISLDKIENDFLREPHTLYNHIKNLIKDDKQYYILLDEIQLVSRFHEVLISLLQIENADTYVTGSNSKFLSSDILTEFRGRGDEIRVYPLSFSEYLSTTNKSEEEVFDDYLIYGGLPQITSFQSEVQKMKYLTSLFQETYLKDVIERNHIRNNIELEDLLSILSSSVGSLVSPSKLENTFKTIAKSSITDKTIKNYISCLKDAFMIDSAIRYDIKGRKYINTPTKVYFTDIGIRNAVLGFRQIEETHLMENIIFNELKHQGYAVDIGIIEVREKTKLSQSAKKQLEIDFIARKGSKKYYIQSAFAMSSAEKEYFEKRPLLIINDSFKKVIIIGSYAKPRQDENGITTIGLRNFLKDASILEYL
ncbi:MAG: ATP-binding protein [Candidatus Riflebacteria bacterium]|nr:ATP-binding protein [Candidatus Riflebacteria bacterium]